MSQASEAQQIAAIVDGLLSQWHGGRTVADVLRDYVAGMRAVQAETFDHYVEALHIQKQRSDELANELMGVQRRQLARHTAERGQLEQTVTAQAGRIGALEATLRLIASSRDGAPVRELAAQELANGEARRSLDGDPLAAMGPGPGRD